MTAPGPSRVLVIKLAALGDFVQALGPFAAIRRQKSTARLGSYPALAMKMSPSRSASDS